MYPKAKVGFQGSSGKSTCPGGQLCGRRNAGLQGWAPWQKGVECQADGTERGHIRYSEAGRGTWAIVFV